jgi:hypothetical protein
MAGTRFYVMAQVIPPNGLPFIIDVEQGCAWAGGPTQRALSYPVETKVREDVNGRLRLRKRGFRPQIALVIIDGGGLLDSDTVAQLVSALMDQRTVVQLTLDGGATWRDAVIAKFDGPKFVKNKAFVGVEWDLTLQAVELIPELPSLAGGW